MAALARRWDQPRVKYLLAQIGSYVQDAQALLDIGCGTGYVTEALIRIGKQATAVDIRDNSLTPAVRPIVYDGVRLPFGDKSFDAALLITVLHHTPDPVHILREAKRVADQIIIVEDIYETPWQKYWTYFWDSLTNLQFIGHPHNNKTDKEWKDLFEAEGLKLLHCHYCQNVGGKYRYLGCRFQHGVYHLLVSSPKVERAKSS